MPSACSCQEKETVGKSICPGPGASGWHRGREEMLTANELQHQRHFWTPLITGSRDRACLTVFMVHSPHTVPFHTKIFPSVPWSRMKQSSEISAAWEKGFSAATRETTMFPAPLVTCENAVQQQFRDVFWGPGGLLPSMLHAAVRGIMGTHGSRSF